MSYNVPIEAIQAVLESRRQGACMLCISETWLHVLHLNVVLLFSVIHTVVNCFKRRFQGGLEKINKAIPASFDWIQSLNVGKHYSCCVGNNQK